MKLWYGWSVAALRNTTMWLGRFDLCDKHDMFRDLQPDNAIDFADFTDS